jgi:DNA-binding transcriptional regulator YiaG
MSINISAASQPIYTEAEAAKLLRLSPVNLRRIRTRREIEHYRFSKRVMYSAAHLDAYMRRNEYAVEMSAAA